MDWQEDDALVIDVRPQGDTHATVWLLTREHGLHAGLVRGGQGKAKSPVVQPGNRVRAVWRARLEDQLGDYALELADATAARFFDAPLALASIRAAAEILRGALPERHPYPQLWQATAALFAIADERVWPQAYVRWELGLLTVLGFGLALDTCALTGSALADEIAQDGEDRGEGHGGDKPVIAGYVSPKTGRAVSLAAGKPWRDRLLPLPGFLVAGHIGANGPQDLRDVRVAGGAELALGLELTGFFLARHVFAGKPQGMLRGGGLATETADHVPFSRHRLLSLVAKSASVAA